MQYRRSPKIDADLSVLGFGCMRFPRTLAATDMTKTEALFREAIEGGVNYFDTAYVYPGSESATGEILAKDGLRERVYLATKLPRQLCKSHDDLDRIFSKQLERLKTGYIDFYLIHNLPSLFYWQRLVDLGIEDWIAEKKQSGQVRWIGFSFHGAQNDFIELLDVYDWDFCQIQYNYLDENYQAGRVGLKAAYAKGVPVIIMEPLRGGKLATGLPKEAAQILEQADPQASLASWAFKWLYDQPEPSVVLSGMNAPEQLRDNLAVAGQAAVGMLGSEQKGVLEKAIELIKATYRVPCTGCNYCMPCPHGVSIPSCFSAYNARTTQGLIVGMSQYVTSTAANRPGQYSGAANCQACGVCLEKCPQQIEIIEQLKEVKKHMEPFWFKLALKVLGAISK